MSQEDYHVTVLPAAEKAYKKALKSGDKALIKALVTLGEKGPSKKHYLGNELAGFLKIKVPPWRITYSVDDEQRLILIHEIENRDKAYGKLKK